MGLIPSIISAQELPKKSISLPAEKAQKPANIPQKTTNDTLKTIKVDSSKAKQGFLKSTVKSKAKDYTSFNRKENKLYLYNKAEVYYDNMEIKAGTIVIDFNKNEVYAGRIKDSVGEYTQNPVFKQGQNIVEPDSIRFNIDTKKALIFNSRTEQGGANVIAERTKKENDSVYYMANAKITTAEDLDDPEYYFLIRKGKLIPNNKIVTGVTNLFIYDVPTPIGLPFAFFPLASKRTSGVIFPSFGEDATRGYFLQNGGYYFAINDYVDLAVLGDYYTNSSYGLRFESRYNKRYKHTGNLGFRYENIINSERGFPDFSKSTIYNLRWSHSQDSKANPSSRFSASVNLGSSTYFRQSINQINLPNTQNNTLSSSISYNKSFRGIPKVNMSVTATHTQNTNTQAVNLTLPTFQASVSRIFPFAKEGESKKGLFKNINFQYNFRAENRINTTDELFLRSEMFDDAKTGATHTIPVSTNFKLFKHFSVSASTALKEVWTLNTVNKYFDNNSNQIITENLNRFDAFRTYNFSTSVGTTLYGLFNLDKKNKGKKLQAIRHVMRPSISYNINPAFDKYYDDFEVVTADGTTRSEFTRFENSIFGTPNKTFSSTIGLSLSNNLEAKVTDRDSTQTDAKKIKLLNNLNFSTGYNVAGDSLQWSPVRVTGGTNILDNKMAINFGASLDPYALDNSNKRISTFNIDNNGSLFRITNANLTMSYNFSSSNLKSKNDKTSEKAKQERLQGGGRNDDLFGVSQNFSDTAFDDTKEADIDKKKSKFYTNNMPWDVRVAYALNYANAQRQNEISSHSLMFSANIELSPRWAIGGSSSYDFKNQGFGLTQLRFSRDLKSWKMNFSWVPFGNYNRWNFFIGIKSSIFSDLKYEERRRPDENL